MIEAGLRPSKRYVLDNMVDSMRYNLKSGNYTKAMEIKTKILDFCNKYELSVPAEAQEHTIDFSESKDKV